MGARAASVGIFTVGALLIWAVSLPADQTIPAGTVGDATWSEGEVITVLGSISVTGDLVIEPDVEVRVAPIATEIAVENGGRLLAQGEAGRRVHFRSDAASPVPGDWDGITLDSTSAAGSDLQHVEVEHARVGLRIVGVSPSVEHCEFRNLGSADGSVGVNGNPGSDGEDALETVGIVVIAPSQAVIRDCTIEQLTGGNGGGAGSGLPGLDGINGILPNIPGSDGNDGGEAGEGGSGGDVAGVLVFGAGAEPLVSGITVRRLRGGDGGGGGRGGDGGNGGDGGPNADGGHGALGRRGGRGGAGGAVIGINVAQGADPVLVSNEITLLTGGDGGDGGDSGNGGNGGTGGDGEDGTTNPSTDGKPGGNGGNGFPGPAANPFAGGGGPGGGAHGVVGQQANPDVTSHTIRNLTGGRGGNGGDAGTAGAGGNGGRGGAGVANPPAAPGAGGDGGEGSRGYHGGSSGFGGAAAGIVVEGADSIMIQGNEIETLQGGPGGNSGRGGDAGAGGQGGPAGLGLQPAAGGAGGRGGDGSFPRSGGRGGWAVGVILASSSGDSEIRANRFHDLMGGGGGDGSAVGLAGRGGGGGSGAGGTGASGDGGDGGHGGDGSPGGGGGAAVVVETVGGGLLTANNLIWQLRAGDAGLPGAPADGAAGGNGGFSVLNEGAGGNGGDGGRGGRGGDAGAAVALFNFSGTASHYHETIADFDAGLPGSAPTPGGQGGPGGSGSPSGATGTAGGNGQIPRPSLGVAALTQGPAVTTVNNTIVWQPMPSTAIGVSTDSVATLQSDNNIFHNIGDPALGTTLGGDDLLIDPLFANPASGDFQLTRLSPAVDSGTARGITVDIMGHPRPFDVPGRGAEGTGFEFDRGAHESITGHTGYRTEEIVQAILNGVTLSGPGDPLDVSGDGLLDAADVTANVNEVSAALP